RPVLPKSLIVCLVVLSAGAGAARADAVAVKVVNPLGAARTAETVAVSLAEIRKLAPALEPRKLVVVDGAKKPVLSQLLDVDGDETPDQLVFQVDLGARETKHFSVEAGERPPPAPGDFRVYGRFVRE